MWIEVLRRQVEAKGPKLVALELGISRPAVDLILKGTYGASTDNVMRKVENIYGNNGGVSCEVLGEITPSACAEAWGRARRIGMIAGNIETLRLRVACRSCSVRR